MQVAIYGGSFNPPHIGHAMVASWLLWTAQVDEVWLLPTFDHPFSKKLQPFSLRFALCEALARTVGPQVRVSDVEATLPAPSYTLHTLRHLAQLHPRIGFSLVIGADNLPDLPRWKDSAQLQAEFPLRIVGRAGWPAPEGAIVFPDISSTEIRRRLARGESVDHLVPAAVRDKLGSAYENG